MDVVGQRWTGRTVRSIFRADGLIAVSKSLHMMLLEIVSGMAFGVGVPMAFEQGLIEVMGAQLLGHDDVKGWLTARQVMKMWRCRNAAQNR